MKIPGTKNFELTTPFECENGFVFPSLMLNYKTWGTLNSDKSNVIVICHALTGHADAEKWFHGLFQQVGFINLDEDFVICINVPGSCYGSTGPNSINPETGSKYGSDFPILTIRDFVHAQIHLIDHLGITSIKSVIGASMGGMQALEWAIIDPRVKSSVVISAPARHEAWAIGISEAQRAAIYADSKWNNGDYDPNDPPKAGLKAARMMGMITYRSHELYSQRFSGNNGSQNPADVNSYLNYQGEKLVKRFDPLSYVRLTQAMDLHDVGRDRGSIETALSNCRTKFLVIGVSSDLLYPVAEQKLIAKYLPDCLYQEIDTIYGHDGFLVEFDRLNSILTQFKQEINLQHV